MPNRHEDTDPVAFGLGQSRDYMTDPWWRVDAVGPGGMAASFGLPGDFTKQGAFARMEVLKAENPEYTRWAVLKFTKYVHITKEENDGE